MKNIILTIALVLLCAVLVVAQMDVNTLEREGFKAKNLADEMANAATLSLEMEEYAWGKIIFDYDKGNELVKDILEATNRYNNYEAKENSYFQEDAVIDMYYFDQNYESKCKHYRNGVLIDEFDFEFGTNKKIGEYISALGDLDYEITYPCAACIYNAGKPTIHASFISGLFKIKKASIYEYKY